MAHSLSLDPSFDYRTASKEFILARAKLLDGHLVGDIPGVTLAAPEAGRDKGEVGAAVERFFGIPRNARSEADFPQAGIELKVVPLVHSGRGLRAKERTVISMIDYKRIVLETWDTASVRKKLHILFVYFEHLAEERRASFPFRGNLLWQPDASTGAFIQADWERVVTKIRHGQAHQLSESDGRIMGPCTKGADSTVLRQQPFGQEASKPRAFALKPAFTLDLYQRSLGAWAEESLVANQVASPTAQFEEDLLQRFRRYEGRTVADVGRELRVPASSAKSYASLVLRRAFGARDFRSRIREFDEMGLTPRMSRVNSSLMPYEALSFPAFRYSQLLEETWEDSDLLAQVEYMVIVPIHGLIKGTPQSDCVFLPPVFWRPSASELETIRREWELFRLEIRIGRAAELTPGSETTAIHVRPHARDSGDVDFAPVVGPVIRKSFWLNRGWVQSILRTDGASDPEQMSSPGLKEADLKPTTS